MPARRGVAVAVDAEVVPRGAWGRATLADGARVEVVHGGAGRMTMALTQRALDSAPCRSPAGRCPRA